MRSVVLAAFVLAVAMGCSSDDDGAADTSAPTTAPSTTTAAPREPTVDPDDDPQGWLAENFLLNLREGGDEAYDATCVEELMRLVPDDAAVALVALSRGEEIELTEEQEGIRSAIGLRLFDCVGIEGSAGPDLTIDD